MGNLPPQQDSYTIDDRTAAEQMNYMHRISTVMHRLFGKNWQVDAPLQVVLCGMQSTGKSTLLEYLLRVDGTALKRSNVGTRRPIVYHVSSATSESKKTVLEVKHNGDFKVVSYDDFQKKLVEANRTFTKEPYHVRITAPSGFNVVLVDLPGFQAEPVDPGSRSGEAYGTYQRDLANYGMIREINMSYLSKKDVLMVYLRRPTDWEADEDPGFKFIYNLDEKLQRTVLVTNWAEKMFSQFHDRESAEKFLTAQNHRNQNVYRSNVPLFFVDFQTQPNPNGPPDFITQPVPSVNARQFLKACQDKHYDALNQSYPDLADKYKKTMGTLRLGDYLRFVVLRNFKQIAEKAVRLLMEEEDTLETAMAGRSEVNVDETREKYVLMLSHMMQTVMERNIMPREIDHFLVSQDDFADPWPLEESQNAMRRATNEMIDRGDGGKKAGGALWREFVEIVLPEAIQAIEPKVETADLRANLIGVVAGVAPSDPFTTAILHSKQRAIALLDETIEHILDRAAFILTNVFRVSKELVGERIERFSREKHGSFLALYEDREFQDLFFDYLDESFHKFMSKTKDRTRIRLRETVESLGHPSPYDLHAGRQFLTKEKNQRTNQDDASSDGSSTIPSLDDSVDGKPSATVPFVENTSPKTPAEEASIFISYFQWWLRNKFSKQAASELACGMVNALLDATNDDSFVLHMKRPRDESQDVESVGLVMLQSRIKQHMDDALEEQKVVYEEVKKLRKELKLFLTTGGTTRGPRAVGPSMTKFRVPPSLRTDETDTDISYVTYSPMESSVRGPATPEVGSDAS